MRKVPVRWNGIEYPSILNAAKVYGISHVAMRRRIKVGHQCDNDLTSHWRKINAPVHVEEVLPGRVSQPMEWDGVIFSSFKQASAITKISESTLRIYVERGCQSTDDMCEYNNLNRRVVWNGIEYCSLAEAARDCAITREAMRIRINKGYICDADMRKNMGRPKS